MRTNDHHATTQFASWCQTAQRAGVVVVRPVSGVVSVVLMNSITRIADAKPTSGGQERGVP